MATETHMDTSEGNGGRPKTVLVVDDYDEVREMTKHALELSGYTVVEAPGGEEALELARRVLPDLILMDLSMPGLDGFTTIHRLRRLVGLRDVPIIVFSAHTAQEIRADVLAAGCRDFIPKPVNLKKLLSVVRRHIEDSPEWSEPTSF